MKQSTIDILELSENGYKPFEIAQLLNKSYDSVYKIIKYDRRDNNLHNYHSVILLDRIWWVGFTYQDEHYYGEGVVENKPAAFDAIRDFRESVIRRV